MRIMSAFLNADDVYILKMDFASEFAGVYQLQKYNLSNIDN